MYQFNGSSDGLGLPTVAGVGDFTIACRFRRLSPQAGSYPVLTSMLPSIGGSYQYGLTREDNGRQARAYSMSGSTDFGQASQLSVHDLVIRRSGSTASAWVDGVQVHTATDGATALNATAIRL